MWIARPSATRPASLIASARAGRDGGARLDPDPRRLEADPLDERAAPDRHEHQVGLHRLAVRVVDGELGAVVLHLRALLAELERDVAPPELLRELLRGVGVL